MKKKQLRTRNIQLVCGQARPGATLTFLPNMAAFCKEFNEKTKDKNGELVNVKIVVYEDKSYDYTLRGLPTIYLIKNRQRDYGKLTGDKKKERSKAREKERKEITLKEAREVAQKILPYLNTDDIEKATKIVIGTAKSAGVKVSEQ